jgi:hypothetical protein
VRSSEITNHEKHSDVNFETQPVMSSSGLEDSEHSRRKAQLAFDGSGENIQFGSLQNTGMDLQQLLRTTQDSADVVEAFTDGLTAEVFHLRVDDTAWNLKRKRVKSLVNNVDGQTSFLNEVQRRRDFAGLKWQAARDGDERAITALSRIVDTRFASYRDGILLSPWIAGERLNEFNEQILQQLFATVVQLELSGFTEWDLCAGNILFDGDNIWLFDFGYCYPFDPLQHFNSSGRSAPLFHGVERFETRNFFGYLLQQEGNWSDVAILSLFELEKRLAIDACQYKFAQLKSRGASTPVLEWLQNILKKWQQAVAGQTSLEQLFLLESYRSHVLDIQDDISGQSCTPLTLRRIARVETIVQQHYSMLATNHGLFFGDENLSKSALLAKVIRQRTLAEKYQLPMD